MESVNVFHPVLDSSFTNGTTFIQPGFLEKTSSVSKLYISIAVLILASLFYKWNGNTSKTGRPLPGPWGLPFVGRVHDVDPRKPWFKQAEWCFKYNGFYKTTIMGETHLWISDQRIAHDLLTKRARIYSSRPPVPAVPGSNTQAQYLPLMAHDEAWRRQRKFVQTMLSTAANAKYNGYIDHEAKRFLFSLLNEPKGYYSLIEEFCGRISARLNYGSPDSAPHHIRNAREFIPQISPSGPVTNLMPFLGYLPEFLNPSKRTVRERREREAKLWHGLLKQAKTDFENNVPLPPNYSRTYYERKAVDSADRPGPEGSAYGFNPDDHETAYAIGMLCTVAIFTIGGPLNAFFLAMVLHPEWQEKARAELDAVLGNRMLATATDFAKLPILRAAIKETLRWRPAVPLGVPRLVEEDNVYEGYFIPKGTIAHIVELAIARDPELYPEPEAFNPARWLEPKYPSFKGPLSEHPTLMAHHQFGSGRRVCPGVALTEAELLIACSGLLSAFILRKKVREDGTVAEPDPWHMSPNLIGGPLEFEFDLKCRGEDTEEKIKRLWWDAEAAEVVHDYSGELSQMQKTVAPNP